MTIKPDFAKASANKGNALKALGQIAEAYKAYQAALDVSPQSAEVHRAVTEIKVYQPKDPHINLVEQLLLRENLQLRDKAELHYAYAKMSEDIENYNEAFDNYTLGGDLMAEYFGYSKEKDERLFLQIKKNSKTISSFKLPENGTDFKVKPIFILGMPRSGTTLMEQIISSHSMINAAGELRFASQFFSEFSFGNR